MMICETSVPDPKDRFIYVAGNLTQARKERERFRLGHLPVHVWKWAWVHKDDPKLVQEFDL